MSEPLDVATLRSRVAKFPRVQLAQAPLPTPLYPLRHALPPSAATGQAPALFIKRDDAVGPMLGGNKARKLEFLLGDAKAKGATKVVTYGGLQSNHTRITSAAATQLGMVPHVVHPYSAPDALQGNLLLNRIVGAHLHFEPSLASIAADTNMNFDECSKRMEAVCREIAGDSYFIPIGGCSPLGVLGYVLAACELHEQATALGIQRGTVVCGAGTGSTTAGLIVGLKLLHSPLRVRSIAICDSWDDFKGHIASLCNDVCQLLGVANVAFSADDIPLVAKRYMGPAYGVPSPAGLAAIQSLAASDGILTDPIYTGKTFGGILCEAQEGAFDGDDAVIFVHTGGIPAVFAYPEHFV